MLDAPANIPDPGAPRNISRQVMFLEDGVHPDSEARSATPQDHVPTSEWVRTGPMVTEPGWFRWQRSFRRIDGGR